MRSYRNFFLFLTLSVLPVSCSLFGDRTQEEPIARVFDTYLYPSDLKDAIPEGTGRDDSLILAGRYIDQWVKDQLMMQRAEQALPEEQKNFERQLAEYHKSLLIYSYRQKLLTQKLDTVVPAREIEAYYEENGNNFLLNHSIIKGTFVRVPRDAPELWRVRQWSRNNGEDDQTQLEGYCRSNGAVFQDFNDQWSDFPTYQEQLPRDITQPARYLQYNKNIEQYDSVYRYFLHVADHLPEGEAAPLDMVRDDITNILLNKRKIEFFRNLEQQVYRDGVSRNQFEIYK
ncbi:MAG: peptidylprolyl isomerase [Bacteroidales bacterium]